MVVENYYWKKLEGEPSWIFPNMVSLLSFKVAPVFNYFPNVDQPVPLMNNLLCNWKTNTTLTFPFDKFSYVLIIPIWLPKFHHCGHFVAFRFNFVRIYLFIFSIITLNRNIWCKSLWYQNVALKIPLLKQW